MSSRALRKLQKQEDLRRFDGTHEADESEVVETAKPKAVNVFDMLLDANGNDAEETAHSSESDVAEARSGKANTSVPSTGRAKKDKVRKKKGKKSKSGQDEQSEAAVNKAKSAGSARQLDEIDLALKSLSTKPRDGSYTFTSKKRDDTYPELCQLLRVESKQLNALNEMKRLFGNVVLEGSGESSESPSPGRRRARANQNLDLSGALAARNNPVSHGQGLAGLALRKNVFMAGKPEWPKAPSGGLGMEVEEKIKNGINKYRFVHNNFYQNVQVQFETCVASMEPERLIQLLQLNREIFFANGVLSLTLMKAYHISTVLQVSELAKHQSEHSVSGDLLERALFSFGRSVHSSFTTSLSEGKARLEFRRPENREFWLAAWRYISNLCQRGTWRTAYEWAKLILSLDPEQDPFCIVWIIDQLALRGGEADHFLKLRSCRFFDEKWRSRPNILISSALAKYKNKQISESMAELRMAILKYPWIFVRFFAELDIGKIPKSIWGIQPHSEREDLECEVYVHGSKDIWNTQEHISFLVKAVETADFSGVLAKFGVIDDAPITLNEARHVFLSGVPSLIGLIPRKFTSMPNTASDPFPPPDNLRSYPLAPLPPITRANLPELHHELEDLPDLLHQMQLIDDGLEDGDVEEQESDEETEGFHPSTLMDYLNPRRYFGHQGSDYEEDASTPQDPMDILYRLAPGLLPELRRHPGVADDLPFAPEDGIILPRTLIPPSPTMPQLEPFDAESAPGPRMDEGDDHGLGVPPYIMRHAPLHPGPDTAQPGPSSVERPQPYDDERNQRWLANQGLIRLRDFTSMYGVDEAAWYGASTSVEGWQIVEDYARNVKLLRQQRTRDFILNYVLTQGTSAEVRSLITRTMERVP